MRVCVCERDCRKGKLALVGNIMLTLHEMVTIEEKSWRGMPSCGDGVANCGVNTMIQGIA